MAKRTTRDIDTDIRECTLRIRQLKAQIHGRTVQIGAVIVVAVLGLCVLLGGCHLHVWGKYTIYDGKEPPTAASLSDELLEQARESRNAEVAAKNLEN